MGTCPKRPTRPGSRYRICRTFVPTGARRGPGLGLVGARGLRNPCSIDDALALRLSESSYRNERDAAFFRRAFRVEGATGTLRRRVSFHRREYLALSWQAAAAPGEIRLLRFGLCWD